MANIGRLGSSPVLAEWAKFDELISGRHGRLTIRERLTVALVASRPRLMLTVHSQRLDRAQVVAAFSSLMERADYHVHQRNQLLYFAVPACALGASGWHVHSLFWEKFIPQWLISGHATAVGFGRPRIVQVSNPATHLVSAIRGVSYVLGQDESVFGGQEHLRHEPRPKNKRSYLIRQRKTIEQVRPELLSMLDRARDRSLPDDELLLSLPFFTHIYGKQLGPQSDPLDWVLRYAPGAPITPDLARLAGLAERSVVRP